MLRLSLIQHMMWDQPTKDSLKQHANTRLFVNDSSLPRSHHQDTQAVDQAVPQARRAKSLHVQQSCVLRPQSHKQLKPRPPSPLDQPYENPFTDLFLLHLTSHTRHDRLFRLHAPETCSSPFATRFQPPQSPPHTGATVFQRITTQCQLSVF